jgi:hypothetical protein
MGILNAAVTDHAVVRYIERVIGINMKAERRKLKRFYDPHEADAALLVWAHEKHGINVLKIADNIAQITDDVRTYYSMVSKKKGGVKYTCREGKVVTVNWTRTPRT